VLLTLAEWRPDQEPFPAWVARRISEDYPELTNTAAFGVDAPARLVDDGLILPVLDGLDEMPPALIHDALTTLNDSAGVGGIGMVVTCRQYEYEQIIKAACGVSKLCHTV